jgi:prolyl-tRNA synthetase
VVRQADLAENSLVRGTMVIKPYGYALWEAIRDALDVRFKETGHQNLYFPMFIPLRLLEREKEHVEGFAPEFAMVTHAGGEELAEPLVVRPTSETIIWDTYAKWVQSYRDLPRSTTNGRTSFGGSSDRGCSSVRRSSSGKGAPAHETRRKPGKRQGGCSGCTGRWPRTSWRCPSSWAGRPDGTVPGCRRDVHASKRWMRDRKALQAGTSHYLGQNFAKAYGVQYLGRDGRAHFAEATSWGASTRLVGGLIMAHGDERGLRLPPRVAPIQVVVVPIFRNDDERVRVLGETERLAESWRAAGLRVKVDDRDDLRPGYKFADWELRGVPVRVEIGPRDLDASQVTIARRDTGEKSAVGIDAVAAALTALQDEIQRSLFDDALAFREAHTTRVRSYDELRDAIEDPGGFVIGGWCGDPECEAKVKAETKATIRFLPFEPEPADGPCVVRGQAPVDTAARAIAY